MVKLRPNGCNMLHATCSAGLAKRTQHCATWWPNTRNMLRATMLHDVALTCCIRLARAYTFLFGKAGIMYFLNLGVKGLIARARQQDGGENLSMYHFHDMDAAHMYVIVFLASYLVIMTSCERIAFRSNSRENVSMCQDTVMEMWYWFVRHRMFLAFPIYKCCRWKFLEGCL